MLIKIVANKDVEFILNFFLRLIYCFEKIVFFFINYFMKFIYKVLD